MKNKCFILRLLNLLLIIALIAVYQNITLDHARAEEIARLKYEKELAEAEAAAAKTELAAAGAAAADSQDTGAESSAAAGDSPFKDGTYSGSAEGYGGQIEMKVVIRSGRITSIGKVSAPGEDAAYWDMAQAVIPAIIDAQDPNVDTVSGATFSSTGIKNAVIKALQKAVR